MMFEVLVKTLPFNVSIDCHSNLYANYLYWAQYFGNTVLGGFT